MTVPTYHLLVDWPGDGTYTDESARLLSFTVRRGRDSTLWGDGGYAYVPAAECSFTLDDWDQRYNPWNASGALYGTLLPHRKFQLTAEYDGAIYPVVAGWLRNPRPRAQEKRAIIQGSDGLDQLAGAQATPGALQSNYLVSAAMADLIDAAGWPFLDTSGWILGTSTLGVDTYLGSALIESNGDTLVYWWPDSTRSVADNARDLAQAFAGDVFIRADGTFAYRARLTSIGTLHDLDQSYTAKDIEQQMPGDEIRNDVRITARPLATQTALSELWKLNDRPLIAAGATLTITARYNWLGAPCAASAVTAPASSTDYTGGSTIGGTDKTAQLSIATTSFADCTVLAITNNDAAGVYVSLLQLRGTPLVNLAPLEVAAVDATSKTDYGIYSMAIDSRHLQTSDQAAYHAGYALALLHDPRRVVRVRITARPETQYAFELFDRVNFTAAALSIDSLYMVSYIEHSWQAGQGCATTLRLEPAPEAIGGYWVLGTSTLGETTVLGW